AGRVAGAGVALVVVAALVVVTSGTLARQAGRGAAALLDAASGQGGALASAAEVVGSAATRVTGSRAGAVDPAVGAPLVALSAPGTEQACEEGTVLPDGDADVVRALEGSLTRTGDERGLALAACPLSAVTSWVLLGGTTVGERPSVEITATGETPALVDVTVGSVDGPVETPAATGLLVPPGRSTSVAVDSLAPDQPAVVVRVTARSGTVAVTGSDRGLDGLVPRGRDTVPAQTTPSNTAVLPTVLVPVGPGASSRLLLAPAGPTAAVAQVQVSGADGLVDLGADTVVALPGGGVRTVDLTSLPPGRYSVRVLADAPVLASATWERRRDGAPLEGLTGVPSDRAWVHAVSPLDADGALVSLAGLRDVEALEGATVEVVATDVEQDVRGRLELLDAEGAVLAARDLTGDGGTGDSVRLTDLADLAGDAGAGAATLRVVPAGVPLHVVVRASTEDEDGPLVAAASVPGAPPAPTVVRLVPVPLPDLPAPVEAPLEQSATDGAAEDGGPADPGDQAGTDGTDGTDETDGTSARPSPRSQPGS
ncbi:DUF5719 family protein, partial [Aquipuribacter sp. SD81]|uniref:DUF5719 family protein n=1 Tax=Aquipuribacter sp. SD81 TaxID=3127703 RepID=UPI00301617D4